MTRKFLQGLGLETDVIDKIMQANGDDIEREKAVSDGLKSDAAKLSEEITALNGKIKELEAAGGDKDGYKAKYEAEVTAHKATKDGYAAEKDAAVIDGLVSAALKDAGMNAAAIPKALKLYDRAIAERDDAGKLKNTEKLLEYFKGEWGEFFGTVETKGAGVGTPPGGNTDNSYEAQLRAAREKGDFAEQVRIKQEAFQKEKIVLI